MRILKRPDIHIPVSFLLISILWIVFSDKLLLSIQEDISAAEITEIQTIKGSFFVAAVTFLIHYMIRSSNKRLLQSQEEYKDLFYNTPNPMLLVNLKSNKFCRVNKAALETYGYSKKEFEEMSVEDIRANTFSKKQAQRDGMTDIYSHSKKNKEPLICIELSREVSFRNSPATLLSINDITELEKAKSELIQRENQLTQILDSITDGFFILTQDMVVEKANHLFRKLVEVPYNKIEGEKLLDLFPSIEDGFSLNQYSKAIENQEPSHFENYYQKLNKWFDISAYPFEGGLFVFFRDITKEKEAEIQQKQNEQNLLTLINNSEDLMWSVDCSFKYFIFNEPYRQYYKRMFGEEVYVGKCALNEKQGKEHMQKWKALYERALKGEKFTVEMDFVLDDNYYFTTIHLNPIYDGQENIIGAGSFLQDITERKLHLRRIEQQNEQLKQIAFITSHKVRVPLANILGLAEILDEDDPLCPSNYKVIEYIKTSARELDSSIINMVQQTVHVDD